MCHRYGSFSKILSSNNNKNLKQSAYNLNPNYRYNPIHNSYEHQTNLEHFYSNKNITLGADCNYDINNRFRKTTQKDNINKDQSTAYIKMIIPVVEGIRENQEKIINILQGYKQDKGIQEIDNNKNNTNNNINIPHVNNISVPSKPNYNNKNIIRNVYENKNITNRFNNRIENSKYQII